MSIKIADSLHSKIIIARDKRCRKCGSTQNLTCAHYITCGRYSIRFDERNSLCLCWYECHFPLTNDPAAHKEFFLEQLGEDVINELTQISNADLPIYKSWYGGKQHVKELKKRLKKLK